MSTAIVGNAIRPQAYSQSTTSTIHRFPTRIRPIAARPVTLRKTLRRPIQAPRTTIHRRIVKSEAATFTSETNKAANPLRIVFVSAEVGPWSKTGGLGDVVGGLPIALAQRGHSVLTIAPRYLIAA